MAKFVEGELAILQNASYFEEWNGAPAVVVGRLSLRHSCNLHTMECESIVTYKVRPLVEGAIAVHCKSHQLRKLADPATGVEQRVTCDKEIPISVMT